MADETSPLLQDDPVRTTYTSNGHGENGVQEDAERGGDDKPKVNVFAVMLPLAVGVFLVAMDGTIVVSSYASIGSELEQLQNTSWIATGFMPLYGKLSDIFGRKACLVFAYTIFALGCLFCGLAGTMTQLIAARAFAGVGGGGMTTITSIILSDVIPLRSRGTYQGIINIVFATGSAAGAPLGGLLADSIGWRWSFLIQVPATVVAILTVTFALNLPKPEKSDFWKKLRRVDFTGAAALVLAVFFMLFALDRGGNITWNDTLTISSIAASAVLATLFGIIEMKLASEPLAPERIILNRTLIAAYLVNFFGFAAAMATVFHVSLYFQAVLGQTAAQAGVMLLPTIIGGVAGSLTGGLIMQVTGKYYFVTTGAYFLLLAGTTLLQINTGTVIHSLVGVGIGLCITSIGNGSGTTTSLIALIANAGKEDQAIATARTFLIDELPPATKAIVRGSYEQAVHVTLWFAMTLAALAFISSVFIKEKPLTPRS